MADHHRKHETQGAEAEQDWGLPDIPGLWHQPSKPAFIAQWDREIEEERAAKEAALEEKARAEVQAAARGSLL